MGRGLECPQIADCCVCQRGLKLSARRRGLAEASGVQAASLEGGYEAWRTRCPSAGRCPRATRRAAPLGHRARPKIDRIACPWLIRRFVDPLAVFLFVAPSEVKMVGERFSATPFDIEDVFWSHRGELAPSTR